MGLFLQTALFSGSTVELARAAVEQAAQKTGSYELTPELCRYCQHQEGAQVLLEDECPGLGELAKALSKAGSCPVLLLYIYDGDMWGYDFYVNGQEADRFDPMPDYFGPATEFQRKQMAGRPETVAEYFPAVTVETLRAYLVPWDEVLTEGETRYACPGDEFPYGDCWQMVDFTARLGFPWPFDDGEAERQRPVLPTLREILEQELPPQPVPADGWEGVAPLLGSLPSSLDPDYIRRLLEEAGMEPFWDCTPQEVLSAYEEMRAQIRPRAPEQDPFCRRLAVLAGFCARWMGNPVLAFWELYNATDNAILAPDNGGPVDVETLRARGMAVPLIMKRHIAWKDLTRLLELDPENRDIYLLCRSYFGLMDPGKRAKLAQADLGELQWLGLPARDDPRLCWESFSRKFLRQVYGKPPENRGLKGFGEGKDWYLK